MGQLISRGNKVKIYFSVEKNQAYEEMGYIHINTEYNLLDVLVDNGECTSIILDGYLSSLGIEKVDKYFQKIVSKLNLNGELKIIDHNIMSIIYSIYNSFNYNISDLNNLISSEKIKSFHTLDTTRSMIIDNGLEITFMNFVDNLFVIDAILPKNLGPRK